MQLMHWILLGFLAFGNLCLAAEQGMPALEKATQENKHLFIFFYKDSNERTARSQKVFDQALQKMNGKALSATVKANDPAEKGLVEKFDLGRSPMPFVLVLAPNGAITGGFASSFTEQQLLDSIISPGMARCLKGLQEKKLVFLCLQNGQTSDNSAALQGVKEFKADPRFAEATEIVLLDPADPQEQKFYKQLALDPHSASATTVFIAPPAETIAQYKGATQKERFVSDLQKAVSGCCGPGGCCPGGCCPGGKCK